MSGEAQRDDDPDFLDDFIIEDDAGAKDEELDELFEDPSTPPAKAAEAAAAAGADAHAEPPSAGEPGSAAIPANANIDFDPDFDSDDLLFTDHTKGLQPSESFEAGKPFAEDEPSTWRGDGLELDVGIPVDDERGTPIEQGLVEAVDSAEAAFTAELDSLLHSEDEFALETDKELELIESDSLLDEEAGNLDTFVLDDSGGAWQPAEQQEAVSSEGGEAELPELQPLEAAEYEDLESLEPFETVAAEDENAEPGWEPLPGTNMDELAEVDEVGHAEGDQETDADAEHEGASVRGARVLPGFSRRPALVGADAAAEAEGHDLYAESAPATPAVFVGAPRRSGRTLRLAASLAASLAVLAAGAVIVVRPEWFGLRFEPEIAQNVQIQRPRIEVIVPPPPMPQPVSEIPVTPTPVEDKTPQVAPKVPPKEVVQVAPPVQPPVETTTGPVEPTTPANDPSVATTPVVPVPSPAETTSSWPVLAKGTEMPKGGRSGLVRIGNNLLVGNQEEDFGKAVEGMLPGSRAFAQLYNGNYFIGSVKTSDKESITLRVDTGEVTLATSSISRLHELGSADYESLQKVTSGFIRLTNNNRLVGGILSGIADDHVVLEFRSNRVMLPKSAIGEVVQGEGDAAVRLDTTSEEDDWLRKLVERQLGTGAAPNEQKASASPPAGTRSQR
jgi:hypothetical protein